MSEPFEAYVEFCESRLWVPWKEEALSSIPETFDRDAAPEPYVYFRTNKEDPLLVLMTNPGATMSHQCRLAVRHGNGPVRQAQRYDDAAHELGQFYEKKLARHPAGVRILKTLRLSDMMRLDGVLQVEAVPFHSPSFPKKREFLHQTRETEPFREYEKVLSRFLRENPSVAIQASNRPSENPANSP